MTKGSISIHHLVGFGKYGTVGMDFAVSVVLGMLGGWWLDGKFGSSPWLMIAGMVMGVAVGFNLLFKTVKKLNMELDRAATRQDATKQDDDEREHHTTERRG